ncbi:hypothetical protein B0H16DRAFT_839413 [Mycena metata]|uniref:Uncharacterized protein n=1 Tax=Mycena metata TaxID=1033252 RepID=A0AAD7N968_9AGAR|nr:hypothetical protein B0H16DRAFT_839413 [Mycena metata]
MEELKNQPARCQSCIIVDSECRILVAYFGVRSALNTNRHMPKKSRAEDFFDRAKPISKLYENATRDDMGPAAIYDGLPESMCTQQYQMTQHMAAWNQPPFSPRDVRHVDSPEDDGAEDDKPDPRLVRLPHHPKSVLPYPKPILEGRPYKTSPHDWKPPKEVGFIWERSGAYHHCHAWKQQGTKVNDVIGPSADMTGSSEHVSAVKEFFVWTTEATIFVAEIFKELFPAEYETYAKDFAHGAWIREDPGPFLCHVTVYKLQVFLHRDGLDGGPTVTFPTGYFKGGAMIFTDVRAKYSAGHICFAMAHHLYHAVEKWEAIPCPPEVAQRRITPGRISTVHFMHLKTLQTLEDKSKDWLIQTNGGVNSVIPQPLNPNKAAAKKVGRVRKKEREAEQQARKKARTK